MPDRRPQSWALLATGAVLTVLFLVAFHRGAWVGDDAYITFRSVEQLHAGNGPRWNPHDRVQAFTHPLWFALLALVRPLSEHLFRSALLLSLALSLALLWLLPRWLGFSPVRWTLAAALLLSSRAWSDYCWSGLENPLTYLLLALFAGRAIDAFGTRAQVRDGLLDSDLLWLTLATGLLILCRPDNALFCLPPLVAVLWRRRRHDRASWSSLGASLALGLTPLLLWQGFSLVYYGALVPNTAYAKLNTGLPAGALVEQGLHYLANVARWDPATAIVVAAAIPVALGRRVDRWIAIGLLLHLAYVVRIGGDFMAGRFLSGELLLAVILLLRVPSSGSPRSQRSPLRPAATVAVALLVILAHWTVPGLPLTTDADYGERWSFRDPDSHGIADEKGYYYPHNSWRQRWRTATPPAEPRAGVVVWDTIGFFGYSMPLDTIVVDRWALADPFLARLPAKPDSRIGHFERELPAGYLESLETGRNLVERPERHRLYDQVRIVTQGPLFRWERARAIWRISLRRVRSP